MLTPQQLQTLKANTSSTGGVNPTQAMTPEQAKAWISTSSSTPAATRTSSFSGKETPNAFGGNTAANLAGQFNDSVSGAAKAGVGQMGEAIQESKAGKNPIETGLKFGAGAVQTVFSPLAPALAPVGGAINQVSDKISDIPAVQTFANTDLGKGVARGAEDVANASTIAGAVAGGPKAGEGAIDTATGLAAKGKEALTSTPEETAVKTAQAAKSNALKASDSIEKEIRNLGEKYTTVGDALNKAEVSRGSDPIKVISSYPEGKALPTMNNAGKMSSLPAINFLRNQVGTLGKLKENIVGTSKENTPIEDFKQAAFDRIDKSSSSLTKRNADKADVAKIIDKLKSDYPEGIPTSELDKIKTEQAKESTSYNSKSPFSPDSHAIVGQTAADAVVSKPGGEITDELNKLMSSHYDAIKVLKAMNGKTPHGGMLSKHAANIAGEVGGLAAGMAVGHPFLGAMAGRGASEAMTNLLNSHFISNPLKRALVKGMKGEKPEVIQNALDFIDKQEATPTDAPSEPTQSNTPETPPPVESNPSPESTTAPSKTQGLLNTIKTQGKRGFIKFPGSKIPEPDALAKKLTPVDANKLQNYLNAKEEGYHSYVAPDVYIAADTALEKLGLLKQVKGVTKSIFESEQEKMDYLQTLIDHFKSI